MKINPFLSTNRAVEIYEEMIFCRRMFCADKNFFLMPDVWNDLLDDEGRWSIKTFRSSTVGNFKPKAAVIAFDDRATLTVDERLMENAENGCKLSNFILAHELAHLALGHHERSMVTKNFQLLLGDKGNSILPPNLEELEAHFAAVFFQCGVALEEPRWTSIDLANRACSDVYYVKKAQQYVQLDIFQRQLTRARTPTQRVVL